MPSARRSSSRVRSSATACGPSCASASSSCCSARISTSVGSSATVVAVDVEVVAARRRRTRAAPRRRRPSRAAALTRGSSLPSRGPSAWKFGTTLVDEQPFERRDHLEALHVELVGDLAARPRRAATRPRSSSAIARGSGWRTPSLASARAARPSDTSVRASAISASSASSIAASSDVGPVGEVHRLVGAGEVAVQLVGDERAERREQLRDRRQRLVQRRVRGRVGRLPEARPRPAHVPVREVVDELGERLRAAQRVEVLERVGDRRAPCGAAGSGSSGRARASGGGAAPAPASSRRGSRR